MRDPLAASSLVKATPRLLVAACVIALGVVTTACNPTFNWREFRSPDGFAVMFPGRPQTVSREVKIAGRDGADVDDVNRYWRHAVRSRCSAITGGTESETAARERTITYMRDALVRNVRQQSTGRQRRYRFQQATRAKSSRPKPPKPAGKTKAGVPVQVAARLFIVDDRLFQVVALGAKDELSPEALDTFFTSFRLL